VGLILIIFVVASDFNKIGGTIGDAVWGFRH
jgi:hypothetical protein